nr:MULTISPECIES: glycosyltransferase family 4 protein [unclassified Psychrosphaera]
MITTPNLKAVGGVSKYFDSLSLDSHQNIDYFNVQGSNSGNSLVKLILTIRQFFIFTFFVRNYEVVHINPSLNFRSILRDGLYALVAKLFRKKLVIFFHGWEDEFEDRLLKNVLSKKLFLFAFNNAKLYILLGKTFRLKLIGLGVDVSNYVIETTVADNQFINDFDVETKFKNQLKGKKLTIGFMSRIVEEKGILIALDSVKKFKNANPDFPFEFQVAGDGEALMKAKEFAKENELQEVKFLGVLGGKAKVDFLEQQDICLFPTYYGEGLPLTILEAMLYGAVIISRRNAGIPDQVLEGENGFLTESTSSTVFSKILETVAYDFSLRTRIGNNNYIKAINNYTNEEISSRVLKLYDSL